MALPLMTVALLLVCLTLTAGASVVMPSIFSDHMVLQAGKPLPVWGRAEPGERITLHVAGQQRETIADAQGRWRVLFDALETSSQPVDFRIVGSNEISLRDVLVGDVWLCSGQSNMEWPLAKAHDAERALSEAQQPQIRFFVVDKKIAFSPQDDCRGEWKVCTPETAAEFSAVGFFFATDLRDHLAQPIGLVGAYWGGTRAEGWTSLDGLSPDPALRELSDEYLDRRDRLVELRRRYLDTLLPAWERAEAEWHQRNASAQKGWESEVARAKGQGLVSPPRPVTPPAPMHPYLLDPVTPHQGVVLYNGMIAPLVPLALKGVLWYQGESNDHRPELYRHLFPALINDWRRQFGDPQLPFLYVQLASHRERKPLPSHHAWCLIREAQAHALALPKTGMATAIDVGEVYNIHPLNKRTVGQRLARAARAVAYGQDVEWSGPIHREWRIEADGRVRIEFDHVGDGLVTATPADQPSTEPPTPTDELRGFALAGEDRIYHWADARIEGDSVVVWSDRVPSPRAVRYGWASNPDVTLYNRAGLPAVPFRTDPWPAPVP